MGATVTVASKLPMKIEMQCSAKRTMQKKHMGQVWREDEYYKTGPSHIIEGTAYPAGSPPPNMPPAPRMESGFALTFGVDKSLWDAWLAENADSPMVKNKLIFAFEKLDSVKGMAKDYKNLDSGLGPLQPDNNDRRMPKKVIGQPQGRVYPEASPDYSTD
jgi:hypothetical protein